MPRFLFLMLLILTLGALPPPPAMGQSSEDPQPDIALRMHDLVDSVLIDHATARQAFDWWSRTTGIPLVIDWAGMENDGIDPDQAISLRLKHVPADQLLHILMQQTGNDFAQLIAEPSPWYVQIMTQHQANRHPVTRIYEVADLLMEIPHFTQAPSLDLRDALSNTPTGGGGGEPSLFGDDEPRRTIGHTTRSHCINIATK